MQCFTEAQEGDCVKASESEMFSKRRTSAIMFEMEGGESCRVQNASCLLSCQLLATARCTFQTWHECGVLQTERMRNWESALAHDSQDLCNVPLGLRKTQGDSRTEGTTNKLGLESYSLWAGWVYGQACRKRHFLCSSIEFAESLAIDGVSGRPLSNNKKGRRELNNASLRKRSLLIFEQAFTRPADLVELRAVCSTPRQILRVALRCSVAGLACLGVCLCQLRLCFASTTASNLSPPPPSPPLFSTWLIWCTYLCQLCDTGKAPDKLEVLEKWTWRGPNQKFRLSAFLAVLLVLLLLLLRPPDRLDVLLLLCGLDTLIVRKSIQPNPELIIIMMISIIMVILLCLQRPICRPLILLWNRDSVGSSSCLYVRASPEKHWCLSYKACFHPRCTAREGPWGIRQVQAQHVIL